MHFIQYDAKNNIFVFYNTFGIKKSYWLNCRRGANFIG